MATGYPPKKHLTAPSQLERDYRLRGPPRLKVEQGYSKELCDLVAFTLEIDPKKRPSMQQILEHPYLKGTEMICPTNSLKGFVKDFQEWMYAGGQRQSLVNPYGAEAAKLADRIISKPEWRFSTLESTKFLENLPSDADEHLSLELNGRDPLSTHLDQVADMTSTQAQEDAFNMYDASEPSSPYLSNAEITPSGSPRSSIASHVDSEDEWGLPAKPRARVGPDESKIARGEKQLGRLFDQRKSEYTFPGLNPKTSDLPLRNQASENSTTNVKGKEIDANTIGTSNSGSLRLMDASTLKAKKGKDRPPTMAWEFPMGAPSDTIDEPTPPPPSPPKRSITHSNVAAWTPSYVDDYGASNDEGDEGRYSAPSTASYAPQISLDVDSDYNVKTARQTLDLDALMNGLEPTSATLSNYEGPSPIEPPDSASTVQTASPDIDATIRDTGPYPSDHGTDTYPTANHFPGDGYQGAMPPVPLSTAALAPDAPPEVLLKEMERMISEWGTMMLPLADRFAEVGGLKDGQGGDEKDSTLAGVT